MTDRSISNSQCHRQKKCVRIGAKPFADEAKRGTQYRVLMTH